ncbi:MAG: His-Xaa-Ser repeat protein HxsA3 [Oscillospiraceae bacterium]|nr:His-Xaa-Ser repeat protein HxsA3 [Oscillospiraceae bacterium]
MEEKLFPRIQKSVETFLNDEEGNVPRNKLLTVGSMVILMGILLTMDAFAAHRSHSSHSSHSSHKSHSSHRSHSSHNSHSNHANHSNYPSTPSVNTPNANTVLEGMPDVSAINMVAPTVPALSSAADIAATDFVAQSAYLTAAPEDAE